MKQRPILFTVVPLILIGVCASFYFQTAYVLKAPLTDYTRIISKLTLPNWITIISMVISGVLILRSSRWARPSMPITIAIVFWNNYLVSTYSPHFTKTQIGLAALFFAIIFIPMHTKKIQAVLADKNLQWWRIAFRKRHEVPVSLLTSQRTAHETMSYDISSSGLFLKFENVPWSALPAAGDSVRVVMRFEHDGLMNLPAVVVRIVEPRGFYPRGIGLRFDKLSPQEQRQLEHSLERKSSAPKAS